MSRCYKLSPEEQQQFEQLDNEKDKLAFLESLSKKTAGDESFPREAIENVEEEPFQYVPDPNRVYTPRPRIIDWDDEQAGVANVLATNKDIADHVWTPKSLREASKAAEIRWTNGTDETRAASLKGRKQVKDYFVTPWDELPKGVQSDLAIAEIPNHSLTMPLLAELVDMEYYAQFMEERTDKPFLSALRRIESQSSIAEINKDITLKRVTTDPMFHSIRDNAQDMARVGQLINSKYKTPEGKSIVESPANPTKEEMLCADAFSESYKSYEPKIRYLRVMKAGDTIEAFKEYFPDAVAEGKEAELELAFQLRENNQLDDLWDYLQPLDWGIIKTGYDPRQISDFNLNPNKVSLKYARGETILQTRDGVDYPEDFMAHNLYQRLASYAEQIDIQFLLAPELKNWNDMWEQVKDKFDLKTQAQMASGMRDWLDRVQHMYLHFNTMDNVIRKSWIQSMRAIFWNPVLSIRNTLQAVTLHPDRAELVKFAFRSIPPDIKAQGKLFFETFVSQMGGIRKDYLHSGEQGWKFLSPINKVAEATTSYDWSDYITRLHSFIASFYKATKATERYLADGNLDKWIRDSGIIHLRLTERNFVLTHFLGQADKTFTLGVDGLDKVSGAKAANLYIAQRNTDISNFKMKRNTRGIMEMGVTGQTLWNLTVYPRGYAERLYFQAEKIKQTFSGEAKWEDARSGFMDILKLFAVGIIVGNAWCYVTGKKNNPFDAINVLTSWKFGGLYVGLGQQLTTLANDFFAYINPWNDSVSRATAAGNLPGDISRDLSTCVPFYAMLVDIADSLTGSKAIDVDTMRNLRSFLDQHTGSDGFYAPTKQDGVNRNFWEIMRKLFLGASDPTPDAFHTALTNISDAEAKLGTIPEDTTNGQWYTLLQYGNVINTESKNLPRAILTQDNGFSDLSIFYLDCKDSWTPYYELLTADERTNWLKAHPEEEAMMRFWGKKSKTVFTENSGGGKIEANLLAMWSSQYGITQYSEPSADWTDFEKLPE